MKALNLLKSTIHKINAIHDELQAIRIQLGRIEARQLENEKDISKAEFQVFSQWGEDGILQFIFNKIGSHPKTFVEFGVQDYVESNTRFLMINDYWDGLIIDGSKSNIEIIKQSSLFWKSRLKAVESFITKDNINQLISQSGFQGEIGLLSVDIDGNDYWVWDAIDCIKPLVVVAEYNSLWGSKAPVSVPYDSTFVRSNAHYSHLYWGTSISALAFLAAKKGYSPVTANKAGNNVFFVRNDLASKFEKVSIEEIYRKPFFRESRNSEGVLTYLSFEDSLKLIKDMKLINVSTMESMTVGQIPNEK